MHWAVQPLPELMFPWDVYVHRGTYLFKGRLFPDLQSDPGKNGGSVKKVFHYLACLFLSPHKKSYLCVRLRMPVSSSQNSVLASAIQMTLGPRGLETECFPLSSALPNFALHLRALEGKARAVCSFCLFVFVLDCFGRIFIEIVIYRTIHSFNMYISVVFSMFIELCNYHH